MLSQTVAAQTVKITSCAALQPVLPLWKQVQPLALAAPTRQNLGTYSDMVTAPQPLDLSSPMAPGHLTITETQDVDLKLFQAPKTNMHEVPSYYGSRVNNPTLGLLD